MQARSVATFAKILEASTSIIVERGIQGLNTNLVAERAKVNIGTVYHYFPDKTAILIELSKEMQENCNKILYSILAEFNTTEDLGEWVRKILTTFLEIRLEFPAYRHLRRAFHSVGELHMMLESDLVTNNVDFSKLLQKRFPKLSPERSLAVATLLIHLAIEVLDYSLNDPATANENIDECVTMVSGYFESLK